MLHFKDGRVEFGTFCVPSRLIEYDPVDTFNNIEDSICQIDDGMECDTESMPYCYPQYIYVDVERAIGRNVTLNGMIHKVGLVLDNRLVSDNGTVLLNFVNWIDAVRFLVRNRNDI